MAEPTIDQHEYWNGDVGQRWAANQTVLDAAFAPLTDALLDAAALAPGDRVLDVGCGAGETTVRAAGLVGSGGEVAGADISAPLLAVARERPAPDGAAPIAWIEADAGTQSGWERRFDAVISRFGVMFFPDSGAAFANLRAALRPGGRLTFLCWRDLDENPWVALPRALVQEFVPDLERPSGDAPGPFRFADPELVRGLLSGFDDVRIAPVDATILLGHASDGSAQRAAEAAAHFAVRLGPAARMLRDRDEATRERAFVAVAEGLMLHAKDGAVRLDAACWLVTARR